MKRIILVDGNNLMFRSYYATAYNGNLMKNSKGFPTNALYGFLNMINKIIYEEEPNYMAVAFDMGVNFRKTKYPAYKEGRMTTPIELTKQMVVAKELLTAMGIKYFELEPYEADDIIGTIAKIIDEETEYKVTIISSDKDLLQLINNDVEVKLLKQKDYIRYNETNFKKDFGFEPKAIIDLKALAGDPSDNIPGVKGVGEKTALDLLQKYHNLADIYKNITNIKGSLQQKLLNDQENAFFSQELATIYHQVPLAIKLTDIKYQGENKTALYEILEDLEFYSILKKTDQPTKNKSSNEYQVLKSVNDLKLDDEIAFYIEADNENYHQAKIIGMALADKNIAYYVAPELVKEVLTKLQGQVLYTFDQKKNIVLLNKLGIKPFTVNFDLMIAAYLLNYNIKDDLAYLANADNYPMIFYEQFIKEGQNNKEALLTSKAQYLLAVRDQFVSKLKVEDMEQLFFDIEMPLINVLAQMEITGIKVDLDIINELKMEIKIKLDLISREIYNLAGCEFNISSPKQLGEILFDKMGLGKGKKGISGSYKTDVKVLHKLAGQHPIISKILEYRNLAKLYSTYLDGFNKYVYPDGLVHTIYKQNLTRTGRLSSVEPNMQNIPTRDEEGRRIRKAFIPQNELFISADYSQIELRVLAHMAQAQELITAFKANADIHTKVAADIYGINENQVTKEQRRTAKAVIFGIVYGISGFGLGENLEISANEAKQFIDKYLELYPGVKKYMDQIVIEAYEQGCVRTLFNRKRVIDELNNKNYMIRAAGERIALNTPIQGTSADIIKKAMVAIDQEFTNKKIKSKMVLQVHDELIFDVYNNEKEQVTAIVKTQMENALKLSVPLKVTIDYGQNWYDAK